MQQGLAADTGVYTYDRGGLGWSDPAPWPRTYARMADELRQLITAAGIPPPYLLVGHSTGGILAPPVRDPPSQRLNRAGVGGSKSREPASPHGPLQVPRPPPAVA